MAATNETKDFTVFINGEPCLDIQNPNVQIAQDCYLDGEPFLTMFPDSNPTYRFFFGF